MKLKTPSERADARARVMQAARVKAEQDLAFAAIGKPGKLAPEVRAALLTYAETGAAVAFDLLTFGT